MRKSWKERRQDANFGFLPAPTQALPLRRCVRRGEGSPPHPHSCGSPRPNALLLGPCAALPWALSVCRTLSVPLNPPSWGHLALAHTHPSLQTNHRNVFSRSPGGRSPKSVPWMGWGAGIKCSRAVLPLGARAEEPPCLFQPLGPRAPRLRLPLPVCVRATDLPLAPTY